MKSKPCPPGVSEIVWRSLDDDTREVWDELPKHVQKMVELQYKQKLNVGRGLGIYYALFVAICLYVAAWQAGYSPLYFLGNIWQAIAGAR